MSANRFLPPPVRLSQAFESEKFSGGASGSEITRRSFLKRTGGATVATLVAWNLASNPARADETSFESFWQCSFGPLVLVCKGAPSGPKSLYDSNTATERGGNGIITPYQLMGLDINYTGPQNGAYSFTDFLIMVAISCSTMGPPVDKTVGQVVGFDQNDVTFLKQVDSDPFIGIRGGRVLECFLELNKGDVSAQMATWGSGIGDVDFGNGAVEADISRCICDGGIEAWSFEVMWLSAAIEYQNSVWF